MKKSINILLLTIALLFVFTNSIKAATFGCGEKTLEKNGNTCQCDGVSDWQEIKSPSANLPAHYCCGEIYNNYSCVAPGYTPSTKPSDTTSTPISTPTIFPAPDSSTLDSLNPLKILGGDETLTTPGAIISKAMNSFVFPIAGIILFLMLIFGGFQMLMGAADNKSIEEGKKRATTAIIGFIILFASYWIVQLIEIIFKINILGN